MTLRAPGPVGGPINPSTAELCVRLLQHKSDDVDFAHALHLLYDLFIYFLQSDFLPRVHCYDQNQLFRLRTKCEVAL